MSARDYALHSVCPQISFIFNFLVAYMHFRLGAFEARTFGVSSIIQYCFTTSAILL